MKQCAECGSTINIHKHHVFGGPNRRISEKYGMTEYLCMLCHTGPAGIHFNQEMNLRYKQKHQILFEDRYGHEMWMKLIGKNYL
jgi:hypothetical protein